MGDLRLYAGDSGFKLREFVPGRRDLLLRHMTRLIKMSPYRVGCALYLVNQFLRPTDSAMPDFGFSDTTESEPYAELRSNCLQAGLRCRSAQLIGRAHVVRNPISNCQRVVISLRPAPRGNTHAGF